MAVRPSAYCSTLSNVRWYAVLCTGVHWPAYCCHPAQRTAVIQPNVLLYASPTYWHLNARLLKIIIPHQVFRQQALEYTPIFVLLASKNRNGGMISANRARQYPFGKDTRSPNELNKKNV